jgi:L-aminopeptidase/D-esterase-like protein
MGETPSNTTITAVPGVRVGHAIHANGQTGCTVLLGPFRGAADVRGLATGTREIATLSASHLVPMIDAVLLTGGSAFGLAAADGVVRWVAEHGGGFDTGGVRVPIVPAAVIFDLRAGSATPDAKLGFSCCEAASDKPVAEGRVGAGTGATIGKIRGIEHSDPGGVGCYTMRAGPYTIGAIAVVNSVGDVLGFDGQIVAGARNTDGSFLDAMQTLASLSGNISAPFTNTTIAAIATDAPLTRLALENIARAGSSAIVRRVAPANTIYDGDVVFALSTAKETREFSPPEMLAFSAAAQLTLEHAILRAARMSVA